MADQIEKKYYNQSAATGQLDPKWWQHPKEELHNHAMSCCRSIEDRQSYRRRRNVMHARMYSNQFLAALGSNIYARPQIPTAQETRVTLNVIKACIDTTSAKIAKNRPRPLFLTERGSQPQRERAKKLTQYISGAYRQQRVYEKGQLIFRDAGIFGTGFMKLITDLDRKQIVAERVLPDEVIVDDIEALYGEPRTLYHRKWMQREVVLDLWGSDEKVRAQILACEAGGEQIKPDMSPQGDMLYVVECWHLPSGKEATDGKHAIVIQNCTLLEESYKKDYFPLFRFYWTPPVIGYYGGGIVEEIAGIQIEINKLLRDIQQAQHKMCAPQIWIENATHVAKPITNEIGSINRYTGQPPIFYSPGAMAAEVYNHVWSLYKRAFEIVGVSELSATLKKPAGLESRPALREYNDIETERFAITGQAWERFFMDIARGWIDMTRDLFEEAGEVTMNVPGKGFIETIDWEECDMDADEYVMDVFPTALLPSLPAGKLDRVKDLIDMGMIDKNVGASLLDFPDIEAAMSLETASLENIDRAIDAIIQDGKYYPPEQFMDLATAVKRAQQAYLRGQFEGVEEDKQEMLRRWINQALALQLKSQEKPQEQPMSAAPATPPAPAPAGAAPPAAPVAPAPNGPAGPPLGVVQ